MFYCKENLFAEFEVAKSKDLKGKKEKYDNRIQFCKDHIELRKTNPPGFYHPDGKAPALCASSGGNLEPKTTVTDTTWRKLTPLECERLQTVPEGYTAHVSNTQRYRMLGNGWTVDVITHILKGMDT